MKQFPARLRLQILLLTGIRVVLNTNTRMVYPFLSAFARGLGIDLQAMSLILTTRSIIGGMVPFLSTITDARGRKTGMLTGLGMFTLALGITVIWPTYTAFFISQCIAFLGMYLFVSSIQAFLGDQVPYGQRGTAIAISEFGWALSFVIGMPLIGLLIERAGWYIPFPLLTLLGGIGFVLLVIYIPKDTQKPGGSEEMLSSLRLVFGSPNARRALLMGFLFIASNEVLNVMFGVWMEDSFGLKIAALGAASAVIGFAEVGGEIFSAVWSDRFNKKRVVSIGLALTGLAALAIPLLGTTTTGALGGLFLYFITYEFTVVCNLPVMTEVMPEARATFMGANMASYSLGRALGAFIAPFLYHWGYMANAICSAVLLVAALWIYTTIQVRGSSSTRLKAGLNVNP